MSARCCGQFLIKLSLLGAPSPAGHLSTAGVWREAGKHGYSRPRSGEQHHVLRVALPWGVQDAKAAYSHTAWVASCLLQDYPHSCVSALRVLSDILVPLWGCVWMNGWVQLVFGANTYIVWNVEWLKCVCLPDLRSVQIPATFIFSAWTTHRAEMIAILCSVLFLMVHLNVSLIQ